MIATLDRTERLSDSITTFWLRPEKPLPFVAGQFIELTLPHSQPDNRGERRWFTISASPTETPLIAITTHINGQPKSTFKQTLTTLSPGDELSISQPMGDFVLPKNRQQPLLFIAGGIGITPYRSILTSLRDTNEQRDIQLIYTAPTPEAFLFQSLFAACKINPIYIVSKPNESWQGHTGRLTARHALDLAPDATNRTIFLSGPEKFVERLIGDFRAIGIPDHRLVGDYFHNYDPAEGRSLLGL